MKEDVLTIEDLRRAAKHIKADCNHGDDFVGVCYQCGLLKLSEEQRDLVKELFIK